VALGRIAWLACAASVVAASGCVGGDTAARAPPGDAALRGGTLRVPVGGDGLDPLAQGTLNELYHCCLLRTLMSYPGVPTAEGGGRLRPDLAVAMPTVSPDGLTWTFTLRRDLRYAPPYEDTRITAGDVVRAVERVGITDNYHAQYFQVIQGFADFAAGRSDSIAGFEQPDDLTLRVRLTRPAGDLGDRFALPATAPIPAAARGWRTKGGYGPHLATSGPYMLQAAEDGRKARWRVGQPPVRLVRNPSWRRSSDLLRPAYVEQIDLFVVPNDPEALSRRVDAGELDVGEASAALVERYRARPALRSRLHYNESDGLAFLLMNLARAPFDDVHVRRAMNWAVDKRAIAEEWFGFAPATHLVPNGLEDNLLASYDPYRAAAGSDIAAAREQMALSRYDRDGDGTCDAPACRRVAFPFDPGFHGDLPAFVRADAHAIGIDIATKPMSWERYLEAIDPERHPPLVISGWGKDYHNAANFFFPVFYGADGVDRGDETLLGATRRQLVRLGYRRRSVPSIDGKIEQCVPLVGRDQAACWAEADKLLMERAVPAIPIFFWNGWLAVSRRVERYSWNQSFNAPALDRFVLVKRER
jgi:peptide/nickel transport system substrate-binding protein